MNGCCFLNDSCGDAALLLFALRVALEIRLEHGDLVVELLEPGLRRGAFKQIKILVILRPLLDDGL